MKNKATIITLKDWSGKKVIAHHTDDRATCWFVDAYLESMNSTWFSKALASRGVVLASVTTDRSSFLYKMDDEVFRVDVIRHTAKVYSVKVAKQIPYSFTK